MDNRDDSREYAEQMMATISLLMRTCPTGCTPEQVEAMDRVLRGLVNAKANLCEYIILRKNMVPVVEPRARHPFRPRDMNS